MGFWRNRSRSPSKHDHNHGGEDSSSSSSSSSVFDRKEEIILHIPGAAVNLTDDGKAVELAEGDFRIVRIVTDKVPVATIVKVGDDLQWPLTKDEPVVKLDELHYLFTIPDKDEKDVFLNYGVSFQEFDRGLNSLDSFLGENSCFTAPPKPPSKPPVKSPNEVYWKDYAPMIDDYNGVLARAIANGTGQVVRGIFMISHAYASQVNQGAEIVQTPDSDGSPSKAEPKREHGGINMAIRGVRTLSEKTETMSKSVLDGVVTVTGSVSAPIINSTAGKAFATIAPGQVLLGSLDAVNKVLDAVEIAQRQTISATGEALARKVSKRFGDRAGEAVGDVYETAGHTVGTAWNLLKIRKAVNPAKSKFSSIKNMVRK